MPLFIIVEMKIPLSLWKFATGGKLPSTRNLRSTPSAVLLHRVAFLHTCKYGRRNLLGNCVPALCCHWRSQLLDHAPLAASVIYA